MYLVVCGDAASIACDDREGSLSATNTAKLRLLLPEVIAGLQVLLSELLIMWQRATCLSIATADKL
jgi:hypothetical protein